MPVESGEGQTWKVDDLESELRRSADEQAEPTAETVRRFGVFTHKLSLPGARSPRQLRQIAEHLLFDVPASGARRAMVSTLMKALRSSSRLVSELLEFVLPRIQRRIKNAIESQVKDMHLGGGIPLGEEGLMSHYRLEVLRQSYNRSHSYEVVRPAAAKGMSASAQSAAAHDGKAPSAAPAHGKARSLPLSGKARGQSLSGKHADKPRPLTRAATHAAERAAYYREVRRTNLCDGTRLPGKHDEPIEVKSRGIIKRFTFSISPLVGDKLRKADRGELGPADESPTKGVDDYLAAKYPACVAKCLQANLPPFLKAHLPNQLPSNWMPPHMRDEPEKVLVLDASIVLVVRFDKKEALPAEHNPEAAKPNVPFRVTTKDNPFKFEFAVRGGKCLPDLLQLAMKWVTLHAHATIWWNVFDRKMSVAIRSGRHGGGKPPQLKWDLEVSLGGCGLPLPDCIEDELLGKRGRGWEQSTLRPYFVGVGLSSRAWGGSLTQRQRED